MSGMAQETSIQGRWDDYVLYSGNDVAAFWQQRLLSLAGRLLVIVGRGFDPRMCDGIAALIEAGLTSDTDIRVISYDEGSESPSHRQSNLAGDNWVRFQAMCAAAHLPLSEMPIDMWSQDGRLVGPVGARDLFESDALTAFSDVIVDISALPRALYFPLLAKLLHLADERHPNPLNLHVLVSEHPILDRSIHDEGVEESARYLPNFLGEADMQATAGLPLIWVPLLGPGQLAHMQHVVELVAPAQVCPVLPSPALDPRSADELLLEYRQFLFDELGIEPRSVMYASESSPFEVYRQLRRLVLQYRRALAPLGGCKAVLSVHSTKLMSIGALLAAYELKTEGIRLGVADVAAHGYSMVDEPKIAATSSRLFELWITGECYAE
jgi:hypothetical protein